MSDEHAQDADEQPHREEFHEHPIEHARVRADMSVDDLVTEYGKAGIGAANLHEAVDIYAEMLGDDDVTNFFGLAGAMVPTGMRQLVVDLIRDGHIDALVTTGANLTHDAIEAIGGKHHHGRAGPHDRRPGSSCSRSPEGLREHGRVNPDHPHPCGHGGGHTEAETKREHGSDEAASSSRSSADSREHGRTEGAPCSRSPEGSREHDERLRDEGVDRIYNVYLPQEHFALFESHLRSEVFPEVNETVSIQRLTEELGRANSEVNEREDVDEDAGIAAAAYEHDVPIYCPAIQDSVLGLQAWMYSQVNDFNLDALSDMTPLTDLAYEAEKAGAMVVGGGVPKNFVLQTMLVSPKAYDYGVQLTMDPPQTGGLSGATLDEARSWGKLEKAARNVSVYADATITLPLVVAGARDRIARDE